MTDEEKRALMQDHITHKLARLQFEKDDKEWCWCGHRRVEHDDTLSWGHGDCLIKDCTCMKFTWKETI